MRKRILALVLLPAASVAHAQSNSSTNCYAVGNSLNCHTTTTTVPTIDWNAWNQQQQQIQQQNQQNMNEAFANLGAAIAARRERKREEEAAAKQQALIDSLKAAIANDPDQLQPPPTDEQPVRLVCNASGHSASLALYEKHGRVDVSADGSSHTRRATFTPDTISWNSPIAHATLNRLDGSYSSIGTFSGIEGQTVVSGSCEVTTERKF